MRRPTTFRAPAFALPGRNAAPFLVPALALAGLACVHLLTGSELIVTLLMALCLACAWALARDGGYREGTTLIGLAFIARHVGVPAFVKPYLGQPLDSNLYHPIASFVMVTAVIVAMTAILLLIRRVEFRWVLFHEVDDLQALRRFANVCAVIGLVLFLVLGRGAASDSESGGMRVWQLAIFPMAIIARAAYVCRHSEGRRILDRALVVMLATSAGMALLSGHKALAFVCLMGYATTVLWVRGSIPPRALVVGAVFLVLYSLVLGPIVNSLRGTKDMNDRTLGERAEALVEFFAEGKIFETISEFDELQYTTTLYQEYFGKVGAFAPIADRIGMVQNVDALKSGIDTNGTVGLDYAIGQAFVHLLPNVLVGGKDTVATCDYIAWHAGLRNTNTVGSPSLGVVAGAYAAGSWPAVVFLVPVLMTMFFLTQKVWSHSGTASIWSIYFFTTFSNGFAETDVTTFLHLMLRQVPLMALPLFLLWQITLASRRSAPAPALGPRPAASPAA